MTKPSSQQRSRPGRGNLEKPRRARVKVDLWCEVGGSQNQATAHVRNLTVGGCRLLCPCAFPKGEIVAITLPSAPQEPEFRLEAEIRWLALNPDEGPFELGCRFRHSEASAGRVETLLRTLMKKMAPGPVPSVSPRKPGTLELVFASEGLDRLLRPGLSAPLPGSPEAPRGGSARS
ncbi:MAG TPA: PilZ domain-containing protein [Planctomycetota bacterium]|nr:PilZ domain-containing protein [Planctomycetota bacterium]